MKRFFIAIAILSLSAASLLYFIFYYPFLVIFPYHLIVIVGLCAIVFSFYRLIGYLRYTALRRLLQNIICFSFFLSLSVFYLVVLGSNESWGKAIELNLLLSYIRSLKDLIDTLPVQSWILYSFLSLFFCLVILAYYFVRPKDHQNNIKFFKRDLMIAGIVISLTVIFYNPAIEFKRYIYAAGEPVLGFIFPKTWHDDSEMEVYKEVLVKNSSKDKACVEKVSKEAAHEVDRNVIIILVDDLRRKFLSAYGYNRKTTPFLDSMVNSGSIIKVKYPFSPSTATVSGVANLFSSRNINDFSFAGLRLMKYMKFKKLNTYALITGQHSNWYWLANIYRNACDYFYESRSELTPGDDDFVMLKQFDVTTFKPPFFAYMHLMSVHTLGKKHDAFKKYLPDKISLNTEKGEALINNYDNGILQVDFVIKEIFQKLRRDGLLQNSTVFIVSDHGELFGEDGRWKHSGSIHPALQSIPMFIYDQDVAWYQNTYAATLLDIAPTIADRLGYSIPECWTGVSLHQQLKNFETPLASGVECDLPFGILRNKDSIITIDILDKKHRLKKEYQMDRKENHWKELSGTKR